jgi:hypothetical protein
MAARLEWHGERLMHGAYWCAEVRARCGGQEYDYVTYVREQDVERGAVSEPYQDKADAMQDAESEVRRLLREAGVEVA